MAQQELVTHTNGREFSSGRLAVLRVTADPAKPIPAPRGLLPEWSPEDLFQLGLESHALLPPRLQAAHPIPTPDPLSTDQNVIRGRTRRLQKATIPTASPTAEQLFDFSNPTPDTERPEIIDETNHEIKAYYAHEEAEARGNIERTSLSGYIPNAVRDAWRALDRQQSPYLFDNDDTRKAVLDIYTIATTSSVPVKEVRRTLDYVVRAGEDGEQVITEKTGDNDGYHTGRSDNRSHNEKVADALNKARVRAEDDARLLGLEREELLFENNGEVVDIYPAPDDSIYVGLPVGEAEIAKMEAAYAQRLTRKKILPAAYRF